MDKVEQYRQFIKQILTEHAQIATTTDPVKAQLIFDLALLVECLYEAIACIDAPLQKILRNCFQVSAGGRRNP